LVGPHSPPLWLAHGENAAKIAATRFCAALVLLFTKHALYSDRFAVFPGTMAPGSCRRQNRCRLPISPLRTAWRELFSARALCIRATAFAFSLAKETAHAGCLPHCRQ